MIFTPDRDDDLAAELRTIREGGGVPILLLMRGTEPVRLGLDGDTLTILPEERVSFDVVAGFRIEPPTEGDS